MVASNNDIPPKGYVEQVILRSAPTPPVRILIDSGSTRVYSCECGQYKCYVTTQDRWR